MSHINLCLTQYLMKVLEAEVDQVGDAIPRLLPENIEGNDDVIVKTAKGLLIVTDRNLGSVGEATNLHDGG